MKAGVEWHYAPVLSPSLGITVDGIVQKPKDWDEYHRNMGDFMDASRRGELVLKKEVTYGHWLFSGHSGRVLVYVKREQSSPTIDGGAADA